MNKASIEYYIQLPSVEAAWHFSTDANEAGWKTEFKEAYVARIFPPGSLAAIVLGSILAGSILGLLGWLSEEGMIPLPRLEPLFASPHGAVTMFFIFLGISLGFLVTSLAVIKPVPTRKHIIRAHVIARGKGKPEELQHLAGQYGGHMVDGASQPEDHIGHPEDTSKEHNGAERR